MVGGLGLEVQAPKKSVGVPATPGFGSNDEDLNFIIRAMGSH